MLKNRGMVGSLSYPQRRQPHSHSRHYRDWCKPDISMDVIEYAAPSVQHIHLHWSGNQTVLYGWASSENGMPLLCKNPTSLLSKITLHAYQLRLSSLKGIMGNRSV